MRRRLAVTVLAVTAMVTIAFLVPLAAVVRVVAADRAISGAEQESRSLAGVLAAVEGRDQAAAVVEQLNAASPRSAAVVYPDGTRVGSPIEVSAVELRIARQGRAFTASAPDGRHVWVPVRNADGSVTTAVVGVPQRLLRRGVARAWALLVGVGALLIVLGVGLADRLGRTMVGAVEDLGAVTRRLQSGEFDARVVPSGPPEVADVGHAVNALAERIGEHLASEREAAADLSHRLRTPLAALQLEAEGLHDPEERARLATSVELLTDAVSEVIREARKPRTHAPATADLAAVVAERLAFWAVLAEDQGRPWRADLPTTAAPVAVPGPELSAAVDALLANVFGHTPDGTAFEVAVSADGTVVVRDEGPGLPSALVLERGRSGSGSTGLGLDIVRRTAERSGGWITLEDTGAGARVSVRFGAGPPAAAADPTPPR